MSGPSIPERITWSSRSLTSAEVKVLTALWSAGDWQTGRNCRAYTSTLADRSGLSRATVTRTLADLRDPARRGGPLIVVSVRGHRQATGYDIQVDRLAATPPKEQQVSLSTVLDLPELEAQNEPQEKVEAHNEPQDPVLEAQNEPHILSTEERTHTPRAREAALPLIGQPQPPKCAHPNTHAWCDGRVHVPRALHFEFLDRLGSRPGETRAEKAGRLIAFYAADQAQLAPETSVGNPFTYWKAAFEAWIAGPATPAATVPDNVWIAILQEVEARVNHHAFYTWFRPTRFLRLGDGVIEVGVPRDGHGDWILKHHADVLRAAVDTWLKGWGVTFVVDARQRKSG